MDDADKAALCFIRCQRSPRFQCADPHTRHQPPRAALLPISGEPMSNVSAFRPRVSPVATSRNWWANIQAHVTEAFSDWLNRCGVPGAVQPMSHHDDLTGQSVSVRVSMVYTVLTVNGRDYYFHRLSGKFDGTGQSV